jgi:hypothetical protein
MTFTAEARETQRNSRDADVGSAIEFSERISASVSGGSLRSCLFFCLRLSVTINALRNNDDIFVSSQCPCNEADDHGGADKKMRDKNIDPSFCRTSFCQNDAIANRFFAN